MKKAINGFKIILFIVVVAIVFIGTTVHFANKTYEERHASETITEVDTYSMHDLGHKNALAVLKALKNEDADALRDICIDDKGIDALLKFADWSKADIDNAVSMGTGSLTKEPNKKGQQDISERFFINVGKSKYMLFIETRTSELGRTNDGISAIGATTFEHFDATDYMWNGEKDAQSVLVGKLFWK